MARRDTSYTSDEKYLENSEEDRRRGQVFAAWIAAAAQSRGWNQSQLSEAIGMSKTGVGVLFKGGFDRQSGKIRQPEEETIEKIAIATGADEDAGRLAAGYTARADRSVNRLLLPGGWQVTIEGTIDGPLDEDDRSLIVDTLDAILKRLRKKKY